MSPPENRKWMYNRTNPDCGGLTKEFILGVEEFVDYARQFSQYYKTDGTIRCPCLKCYNRKILTPEVVKVHLYRKGFRPNYWYWTDLGEEEPNLLNADNDAIVRKENAVERNFPRTNFANLEDEESVSTAPDSPVPGLSTQVNICGNTKGQNKNTLEPDGDFGFLPSKPAATAIATIIRKKYDHPWLSWKEIPLQTRIIWFEEFQDHFSWLPQHHQHMWKAYNSRSSKRLSNMLSQVRGSQERPMWISHDIWAKLCMHWDSAAYKKKCKQAKINFASDTSSCRHAGGCISTSTHKQNLANALGREPEVDEVFEHIHKKKGGKKGDDDWISPKAKKIYEEFKAKEIEQSSKGEALDAQAKRKLWIQIVGGPKKNRVYGLGSTFSRKECGQSYSNRPVACQVPPAAINQVSSEVPGAVIDQMKETLQKEMDDKYQQRQQEMENQILQLQQQQEQINSDWQQRFRQYQRQQKRQWSEMMKSIVGSRTARSEDDDGFDGFDDEDDESDDDHDEEDEDEDDDGMQ